MGNLFETSLRNKIIVVFLIPTLIIVSLYGSIAYFSARQGLEEELGKRMIAVGQTLSADLSDGISADQLARLKESNRRVIERFRKLLVQTRKATRVRRVFLFDAEFRSLVDTREDVDFGQTLYGAQADRAEIEQTFQDAEPTTSVLFRDEGTYYKTGYAPIMRDGEVVAAVGVEGSAEYFELLRNFGSALTGLGAAGLLLVALVGALFSRALVRPINRLVDAARRLGEGELDEPVVDDSEEKQDGSDEIAFLAATFEEMRRNIFQRDRQRRLMLSGIAHEVKNPLGGIELFCGLLREDIDQEGDSEQVRSKLEKLDKIEREIDYLKRVIEEFRDFAREAPPERERFKAAEFAAEIDRLVGGRVANAGCELHFEVDDDTLELVADREKLRRAVCNLIRNARQACEEGDTITVGMRADGDQMRRITVSDDGPGIPDEHLEEVREPFYTTREKGSGLGLALTEQIVEQHGGTMRIESRVGEGTTVSLRLPFDPSVEDGTREVPEGWLG